MAQFSKAVATLILFASTMAAQHRTPQVRYKIEPSYTKQARKAKIQGLVALRCTVGKDGIPKDIIVTRSLDKGLDQKAIECLRSWIFSPATQDGEPVDEYAHIDFSFKLQSR